MKRLICLLLFVSLFSLPGCNTPSASEYDTPVYFYYPYADVDLYEEKGIVDCEVREGAGFATDPELINNYLKGPKRNELYSPFPAGGYASDATISGNRIRVILSSDFNHLVGLQLTMATSCLGLTLLESKNVAIVEIHILADDGSISRSFFLTRDNIMLKDTYKALPAE